MALEVGSRWRGYWWKMSMLLAILTGMLAD
jgi:hypothetical protein